MRRRLLVVLLGLTTALGLALPAHADPGVIKGVFIEDFQGTTALDFFTEWQSIYIDYTGSRRTATFY